jgi:hypothetical protein
MIRIASSVKTLPTILLLTFGLGCTGSGKTGHQGDGKADGDTSSAAFITAAETAISHAYETSTQGDQIDPYTVPASVQTWFGRFSSDVSYIYQIKVENDSVYVVQADEDSSITVFDSSGQRITNGLLGTDQTTIAWFDRNSQFVADLKSEFETAGTMGFVDTTRDKLPPDAQAEFDSLNQANGPDFPPSAATWSIDEIPVFVLVETTDSGTLYEFYSATDVPLAKASSSETGELDWY